MANYDLSESDKKFLTDHPGCGCLMVIIAIILIVVIGYNNG